MSNDARSAEDNATPCDEACADSDAVALDPEAVERERFRKQRASRAWTGGLAAAALLIGALGTPTDKDMVWGRISVPSTCVFRKLTGRPCFLCGMTRATSYAIHGEFARSWHMHQMGIPVAVALVVAAFYFGIGALWPAAIKVAPEVESKAFHRVVSVFAVFFLIRWVIVLILG
jgi:hypothetical protein